MQKGQQQQHTTVIMITNIAAPTINATILPIPFAILEEQPNKDWRDIYLIYHIQRIAL